jgi:heme A synthase
MSKAFYFSMLTLLATWLLLIIGGLVNPMGASMACPDWYFIPTCNGQLFPPMKGGVLYEHGHRLVASAVGLCTLVLTFLCWRSKLVDRLTKRLTLIALLLVMAQGTLGGITVLLNLSAFVSTLHLLCAMLFFSLLVFISFRLSPNYKPMPLFERSQWGMLIAITLTLLQLVYGGVVRHMGAGLACGDDLIGCGPELWPSWFYGQLHMGHRLLGYAIFLVVIYAGLKSRRLAKERGDKLLQMLALTPIFITFCQLGLGLLTIYTVRSAAVVAMHTGFGALLLASLLSVYLLQLDPAGRLEPNVGKI